MSIWTQRDWLGKPDILFKKSYLYKSCFMTHDFSWRKESVHEKNILEYGWGLIAPATLSRWSS